MSKVVWLPEAIEDIQRLHHFLKLKDVKAAAQAAACIRKGTTILKTSPRLGRPMADDETDRRELFVPFGSGAYVLRYKIVDYTVVVIRVWHSRENRS